MFLLMLCAALWSTLMLNTCLMSIVVLPVCQTFIVHSVLKKGSLQGVRKIWVVSSFSFPSKS